MTCDHKFIDSNYCAKCGWHFNRPASAAPPPTYTDDIVAVMRDTIAAQRDTIDAKNALIADLRAHLDEARAQACLDPYGCWKELRAENERLKAQLAGSALPEGM